jgi:hypothetical protein
LKKIALDKKVKKLFEILKKVLHLEKDLHFENVADKDMTMCSLVGSKF